jgi:hypothetical protein
VICRELTYINTPRFVDPRLELAAAAFKGFAQRSASGDVVGIYWKMSTDLSRQLIYAIGMHDALDGFITFSEVQYAGAKKRSKVQVPGLTSAIDALSKLCRKQDWTTDDPLGIGGLLFDACRVSQLTGPYVDQELLEKLTDASEKRLRAFLASRTLMRPLPAPRFSRAWPRHWPRGSVVNH